MLQADKAEDFVIATGATHTVRELCEVAFGHVGLDWEAHIKVDQRFMRPAEVDLLLGDSSKARRELGWQPEVDFKGLVKMMVDADLVRVKREMQESKG